MKTWDIDASRKAREAIVACRLPMRDLARPDVASRNTFARIVRGAVVRESVALRILEACKRAGAKC